MSTDKTENKSGLVIAGLVIAIISLVLAWVPIVNNIVFFFAILSLMFGIVGFVAIKKGKRTGQGLAIATIILSLVAGGMVLASQAFYGKALDAVGDSVNETMNDYDGTNTDKLLKSSVEVTLGDFVFNSGEEANYTYDDKTELPVTIKNKASEKASYTVKIEAVDAENNRIADDTVYVTDLNAGQSVTEKAFTYVEADKVEALKTATFKILEVSK